MESIFVPVNMIADVPAILVLNLEGFNRGEIVSQPLLGVYYFEREDVFFWKMDGQSDDEPSGTVRVIMAELPSNGMTYVWFEKRS